jgi:hypothetical protein
MSAPATTPVRTESSIRWSLGIYLGLIVYLVVVKVTLELGLVEVALPSQEVLFGWPVIGIVALAGGLSVWLGPRTGLPYLWDTSSPPRKWLLLPVVAGLGVGAVNLVINAFTGHAKTWAEAANVASINVPFPESVLFYSGGAIIVEALYRLVPIALLLWLMANVILRNRGHAPVFWVLAILTSLLEPTGQMSMAAGNLGVMLVVGAAMFALNLFEVLLLWRYGFLAPLVFRVAFYFVWHIVGGAMGL